MPVDNWINRGHWKIDWHGQGWNYDINFVRAELRADQAGFGLKGQEDIPNIAAAKVDVAPRPPVSMTGTLA